MSLNLQNSLNRIADKVVASEENKQTWLNYATTTKPQPLLIRKKTSFLIAAVIAVMVLAGFAYIKSVYFDKIFGEPFSKSTPSMSNEDLKILLKDLSIGDVLNKEIETDEGIVLVKAIRGDTLDGVVYGLKGDNSFCIDSIPHNQEMTKENVEQMLDTIKGLKVDHTKSLDEHIQLGEFIAALDSSDYTVEYILLSEGKPDTLLYKSKSGETIQVSPVSGKLYMDEKTQENALINDITIDGRVFTIIEHPGEPKEISIYYYIDEGLTFNSISLSNFDPRSGEYASKEQMLDAAKYLVLHNEQSNAAVTVNEQDYYSEEFFWKMNDSVIQEYSKEISKAIREVAIDEEDLPKIVWEKDGRSIWVESFEEGHVDTISLNYDKAEYGQISKMISLLEVSPFSTFEWYPADKLQTVTIFYNYGRLSSVFWHSKTLDSSMNIRYVHESRIGKTPLDTLAKNIHSTREKLIKVIKSNDGIPYLITAMDTYSGQTAIKVTTAQKYGGKILLYQLHMNNELSGDAAEQWINNYIK